MVGAKAGALAWILIGGAILFSGGYRPYYWSLASLCLWICYAGGRGHAGFQVSEMHQVAWGFASIAAFVAYLWRDPAFQGWGDVYFFCGRDLQFCHSSLEWNLEGWLKALVLWNFVLTSTLAIQKIVIEYGLNGLLPGEEVVTKDSFVSICWRLIPYCFNNWEKSWGAECTSMMFELPHFALELLVVLPCVQILCSRMKVLTIPAGRVMRPRAANDPTRVLAPCVMQGVWRHVAGHDRFLTRLRYNLRPLLMVLGVMGLAAANAIIFPVKLESQILWHPRARLITHAGRICERNETCWAERNLGLKHNPFAADADQHYASPDHLKRSILKHAIEILKMQHPLHLELVPLVECALAALRMSCEKYFLLISVFAAYLLFFTTVPHWFKVVVRVNHRLSKIFQKTILYTFPAVCWIYGAGTIFSMFVSLIFWMAPAKYMYQALRGAIAVVQPLGLRDASVDEVENMNGNCTVCWLSMAAASPAHSGRGPHKQSVGKALSCGHAFHGSCIQKWLLQCHRQNRLPTCPLCNRAIQLQVKYQLPKFWNLHPRVMDVQPQDVANDEGAEEILMAGLAVANGDAVPQPAPFRAPTAHQQQEVQAEPDTNSAQQAPRRAHSLRSRLQSTLPERSPRAQVGASSSRPPSSDWQDGPDLPLQLSPGKEHRSTRYRRRHPPTHISGKSLKKSREDTAHSPGDTSMSNPFLPKICEPLVGPGSREPTGQKHRLAAEGSSFRQVPAGQDLAAVQRDRHRAEAYMELCQAEEARMRARIREDTGYVRDAKQTASALLCNIDKLEQLVRASSTVKAGRGSPAHAGERQAIAELWQQQRSLWEKTAQKFHE